MSYCRFRNTLNDLEDCYEALCENDDTDLSEEELSAKNRLVELCKTISKEFQAD